MKRSFVLPVVTCVLVLGALAASDRAQSAAKQTTKSVGLVLFDGDSVEIAADGLAKLAAAARGAGPTGGQCPRGTVTTIAAKGDELFQSALAQARRDAVLAALSRLGVDVSQFVFETRIADTTSIDHDTELTYGVPPDTTAPTLHTSSQPKKGSRVKPGQQIVVTMTARDETTRWQTGIKTIELFADSEGGRLVKSQPYPPHPPTCARQPEPQTLSATYTVPSDPPPIVRLRAVAKDHAGHQDFDVGEFPTGDWYGTITSFLNGSVYNNKATIEFSFSLAPDGSIIEQRGRARVTMEPFTDGPWPCTYSHTINPSEFPVAIEVTRDFLGNEFEIKPSRAGAATFVYTQRCGPGMPSGTGSPARTPYNALALFGIVRGIRVEAKDGGKNQRIESVSKMMFTDRIVIHRVREQR